MDSGPITGSRTRSCGSTGPAPAGARAPRPTPSPRPGRRRQPRDKPRAPWPRTGKPIPTDRERLLEAALEDQSRRIAQLQEALGQAQRRPAGALCAAGGTEAQSDSARRTCSREMTDWPARRPPGRGSATVVRRPQTRLSPTADVTPAPDAQPLPQLPDLVAQRCSPAMCPIRLASSQRAADRHRADRGSPRRARPCGIGMPDGAEAEKSGDHRQPPSIIERDELLDRRQDAVARPTLTAADFSYGSPSRWVPASPGTIPARSPTSGWR